VLALPGPPPAEYDGNLLLGKLLGAELRFCTEAEWEKRDQLLQDLAGRARVAGRTPFIIPEGAATVAGALGYFVCGQEIAQQVRHGAPEFDTIVISAFTGGSLAGLLMARQLTGLRSEVVGVPVAGDGENVRACVTDVITQAARRYGLPVQPPPAVRLLEGWEGGGEVRREELETVLRLARLEGLMLDPADTARAFGGLLDRLRREPGSLGRRVCFVHTGGVFGVFPFRDRLGALADTSLW
jgi:D-cysteine desulfhydrase